MPAFLDKSPETGLSHFIDDNEDSEIRHWVEGDIEPTLEYAKAMRAEEAGRKHMKKYSILHYATIDPVAYMKLLHEDGIDPMNQNHQKRLFQLLNTKYKNLKTTNMVHTVKG